MEAFKIKFYTLKNNSFKLKVSAMRTNLKYYSQKQPPQL